MQTIYLIKVSLKPLLRLVSANIVTKIKSPDVLTVLLVG